MIYMEHLNGTMSGGGQIVMAYYFEYHIWYKYNTKGVHIKFLDEESFDSLTTNDCCSPVAIR